MTKRNSIWVAVAVVGTAGALVGATTAFGSDVPEPVTAAQRYSVSMSPEQLSLASQGQPGEVAPPCPDVAVVTDLKAEGLPVGPCVPVPEKGHPVLVPLEDPVGEADAVAPQGCAVAYLRSTGPGSPNKIQGPCGTGVAISDVRPYVDKAGRRCATVTYVSAGSEEKTDSLCPGDKRASNGLALVTEVK